MKTLLLCSLLIVTAAACYADIQDPPANDYGPTRKLSRAQIGPDRWHTVSYSTPDASEVPLHF